MFGIFRKQKRTPQETPVDVKQPQEAESTLEMKTDPAPIVEEHPEKETDSDANVQTEVATAKEEAKNTEEAPLAQPEENNNNIIEEHTPEVKPVEEKEETNQPSANGSEAQGEQEIPDAEVKQKDTEEPAQAQTEESQEETEEESGNEAEPAKEIPIAIPQHEPTEKPAEKKSFAESVFNCFSYVGLPMLLILSACMTGLGVWLGHELWFTETTFADVVANIKNGDWIVLSSNGTPFAAKPPLAFWLAVALEQIPYVNASMAILLSGAIAHALVVIGVWILARATGFDRYVAFASGLVALCLLTAVSSNISACSEMLFAGISALGMACLYRGWTKERAFLWLTVGFLLMGVSVLANGPLGLAIVFATGILFSFWRWTPGRLNGRDGILGFTLMLLMLCAWIAAIYFNNGADYLREMVGTKTLEKTFLYSFANEPIWYYAVALPLVCLPWCFLGFFVNWFAALKGYKCAFATRKEQGGSSWLWLWIFTGFAILTAVAAKSLFALFILLPPVAVLTGRSIMRLSSGRSRMFFGLASIIYALTGLALILFEAYPFISGFVSGWLPVSAELEAWINAIHGTMYIGGVLVLLAVVLLFFTNRSKPGGALLVTALGMVLLCLPYQYFTAPTMQNMMSPKAQADIMAKKASEGFALASYNTGIPTMYSWHVNKATNNPKRLSVKALANPEQLSSWLANNAKAVIAMPATEWDAWKDKPATATIVLKSWLGITSYVVAVIAPAEAPKAVEAPANVAEQKNEAPKQEEAEKPATAPKAENPAQ